jgi:hypothetical protein
LPTDTLPPTETPTDTLSPPLETTMPPGETPTPTETLSP